MQITKKLSSLAIAVAFSIVLAAVLLFGFASSTYAAEGTDNTPIFYCTYTDSEGNEVYGGALTAGTYDVSFYTENVSTISAIEITSTYDTEVVTINGIVDPSSSLRTMGSVTNAGNLVFGYVSDGDYVSVDSEGELITTVNMTFAEDCDAKDCITVSENPNLTFIVADSSNDNYDDEYAVVTEFDGYNGELTKMNYNLTPSVAGEGYDISGCITIATTIDGASSDFGIIGITVDVLDAGNTVIATDITKADGSYTLECVPEGEYTLSIHGPTTIDRQVNLVVTESKTVDSVGIAICDYNNKDGLVNATDKSIFYANYGSDYVYADFNADGLVNATDKSIFFGFFGKTVQYDDDVTLY